MNEEESFTEQNTEDETQAATGEASADSASSPQVPAALSAKQRRILGVLIEKARTTPDSYPLSLNGLVTGCNQKSNRSPLMNLSPEEVEDELSIMRERGVVAEVHGGGRVPKYRHYAHDYLGVKGVDVAVMAELLLRGEQSVGDLRARASRFEPIADVNSLLTILKSLESRQLVVALTPAGRGQLYTHNLYEPDELEAIRGRVESGELSPSVSRSSPTGRSSSSQDIEALKKQLAELQSTLEGLDERIRRLEG